MRWAILMMLAASGPGLMGTAPAHAVGSRYAFCIQGEEFPGLSNCTFTTYEQCRATASGRHAYCIANPYYAAEAEPGAYRERPLPPGNPSLRH
jgi:hypothetical protein